MKTVDENTKRGIFPQVWDSCLDIASFAGVGYLCGRGINWLTKWTSKPSFFGKSESVDLKNAAMCCALFITIDRLAQTLLIFWSGKEKKEREKYDKPLYTAFRIGISLTATVTAFNALAPNINRATIEFNTASTIILTALMVYSLIILFLDVYDHRS